MNFSDQKKILTITTEHNLITLPSHSSHNQMLNQFVKHFDENLIYAMEQKLKIQKKQLQNLDNDQSLIVFEKLSYLVLEMYNLLADEYAEFQDNQQKLYEQELQKLEKQCRTHISYQIENELYIQANQEKLDEAEAQILNMEDKSIQLKEMEKELQKLQDENLKQNIFINKLKNQQKPQQQIGKASLRTFEKSEYQNLYSNNNNNVQSKISLHDEIKLKSFKIKNKNYFQDPELKTEFKRTQSFIYKNQNNIKNYYFADKKKTNDSKIESKIDIKKSIQKSAIASRSLLDKNNLNPSITIRKYK